jgi:hypothetical protein
VSLLGLCRFPTPGTYRNDLSARQGVPPYRTVVLPVHAGTPATGSAICSQATAAVVIFGSWYVTGSLLWPTGIIAVTAPLAIARYRAGC